MLRADGQYLLLIDVPLQERANQLQTYEIFNLPVSHSGVSAQYKITKNYIGVTYDKTQAVMITEQQYSICPHGIEPFCKIDAPFQAHMPRMIKIKECSISYKYFT